MVHQAMIKAFIVAVTATEGATKAIAAFSQTLPAGKFASREEYAEARKALIAAAVEAGKTANAAKITLTRAGFTATNPDHKPRGRRGGAKKKEGKEAKGKAPSTGTKLSEAETALLVAYRNHDVVALRRIADEVEAENVASRRR
jgi:hypothetical protein